MPSKPTSDGRVPVSTSQPSTPDAPTSTSGSSDKAQAPSKLITLTELLDQQSALESQAAEVLPFDCSRCTHSLGPLRQPVYSCLTCNPPGSASDPIAQHVRAGVCSACSVSCHADHQLVELFVRRNFVCDCGTARCQVGCCELRAASDEKPLEGETLSGDAAESEAIEHVNKYDQNFDGQFCICERGRKYDPETESEDMYQCLACEDWRHASCLGPVPDPESWDDLICAKCVQENKTLKTMLHKHAGGSGTGMMIYVPADKDKEDADAEWHGQLVYPNVLSGSGDHSDAPANPQDASEKSPKFASSENPIQTNHLPLALLAKRVRPEFNHQPPSEKRRFLGEQLADRAGACTAPFPVEADSLLAKVEPSTANVFMAAGWRQKWCQCLECFKTLSEIGWVNAEEEDVWEPAEDRDSSKSLHELGMEAFENLPHEQKIEGLRAYNKLRDHMMNFLKPFSEKGLTVTEEAIKNFFALEKEKIKRKVW